MRQLLLALLVTVVLLAISGQPAAAMPMFARKLNVPCETCHTTIPRLNETGYKFRAAGFRMPDMIGKPDTKAFEFGDYFSGRIQAQYDASRTTVGPTSTTINRFSFTELTVYPVTGAWGKYLGSLVELSFAPEEPAEVENAYIRVAYGNDKNFLTARAGVFHPFEGFGASDRPSSINRTLFQRVATNFNQNTFFTSWGFDQAGGEVGVDLSRLSLRAAVLTGLVLREEDGVLQAFPAQGGPLTRPTDLTAHNTPDFQFFANYILNSEGGGVSLYYYRGNIELPTNPGDVTAPFWRNNFDRWALYLSYPVAKYLRLYGGVQKGRDHTLSGGRFNSIGEFAEAEVPLSLYVVPGVRWDKFDPATDKPNNEQWALTPYVNIPIQNGLQFIGEFRHRNFQQGAGADRNDNAFQIRFIFIL